MKYLYAVLIILFSTSLIGQSFQVLDESYNDVTNSVITINTSNPSGDTLFRVTTKLHIRNLTSSTMVAKGKRIETTVLPGSSHYHCYGIICYDDEMMGDITTFPDNGDAEFLDVEITPGNDTTLFRCYFKPRDVVGNACIRYVVFAAADSTDSVYFDICVDVLTSIEEQFKASELKVYPNPASEICNIDLSSIAINAQDYQLQVYDALGKKMKSTSIPMGSESTNIDVSDMAEGMYLFVVEKNGEAMKTGKLVVSR